MHALLTRPSLIRSIARRVTPRRLRVAGLKWAAAKRQTVKAPGLTVAERRNLLDGYREDIRLLETLIGRDLSRWLQCPEQPCEN